MFNYGSTKGQFDHQLDQVTDLIGLDQGFARSPQADVLRAIRALRNEWMSEGNMNWDFAGPDRFLKHIEYLWRHLMPDEVYDPGEEHEEMYAYREQQKEELARRNEPVLFSAVKIEQIKRDLAYIEILGLAGLVRVTPAQAGRILKAAAPDDEYMDAPFMRLSDRVVEWCRFHRDSSGAASDATKRSLEIIFNSMTHLPWPQWGAK